jgi:hypothetical protein
MAGRVIIVDFWAWDADRAQYVGPGAVVELDDRVLAKRQGRYTEQPKKVAPKKSPKPRKTKAKR